VRLSKSDDLDHAMGLLKQNGIEAEDWQSRNGILMYSLKMEKRLMSAFLALTIMVSTFSIVGVLMVLVAEKRADIGILKSMGARDDQIKSIFIKAGLNLGIRGILGGLIPGLVILFVLKYTDFVRLPAIYVDRTIPAVINPWAIGGICLFGVLLSIFGAWIPSKSATKYTPLDALRGSEN
jgi:lipoprotein-releasing system permease protein